MTIMGVLWTDRLRGGGEALVESVVFCSINGTDGHKAEARERDKFQSLKEHSN